MRNKTKFFFVLCCLAISAFGASAQTASRTTLNLDPNIIAAAECNGALFAVSMFNYETNILNEERARVMLRTTTLAFFLTAIRHQTIQHILEYGAEYDALFSDSYDAVYDDLIDNNFDWDSQKEIDVCTARIFDPITSVSEQQLANSGIENYFQFLSAVSSDADQRFDYILEIMAARR